MLLYSLLLGTLAALTAAQSDVLSFSRVPNPVTDGEPNVLLWTTNNTQAAVTIVLQEGPITQLKNVTTITKTATGGQYIWTPPVSLADGTDYRLLIIQGNQNNTYGPFVVQGANPAAVSSASVSASNSTRTTMTASMGTGTSMHRNTTMSVPHLTAHHTTSTRTSGTTPTHAIASSSSSGAAVADISTSSSSLALVLGAVAAIFCLH